MDFSGDDFLPTVRLFTRSLCRRFVYFLVFCIPCTLQAQLASKCHLCLRNVVGVQTLISLDGGLRSDSFRQERFLIETCTLPTSGLFRCKLCALCFVVRVASCVFLPLGGCNVTAQEEKTPCPEQHRLLNAVSGGQTASDTKVNEASFGD